MWYHSLFQSDFLITSYSFKRQALLAYVWLQITNSAYMGSHKS